MPDGIMPPEQFEKLENTDAKFNYQYSLIYELYRKQKWDSSKSIFGGFMGGFVAVIAKCLIWK